MQNKKSKIKKQEKRKKNLYLKKLGRTSNQVKKFKQRDRE